MTDNKKVLNYSIKPFPPPSLGFESFPGFSFCHLEAREIRLHALRPIDTYPRGTYTQVPFTFGSE